MIEFEGWMDEAAVKRQLQKDMALADYRHAGLEVSIEYDPYDDVYCYHSVMDREEEER